MANGVDLRSDADRMQRLDRLRAAIHGCANLAQLGGRLENLGLDAVGSQGVCGGEAGESSAYDGDPASLHELISPSAE